MEQRAGVSLGLVVLLALPLLGGLTASPAAAGAPVPDAADLPVTVFPLEDPFDYSDTILLGNNNSQTSRNLTLYFQAQRGVPDENVLFADLPPGETISEAQWDTFAGWFVNETANRSLGSQVNYIVTFKDMPIRVSWSHPGNNGPTSFQDELMLLGGTYEAYIGQAGLYGNPYYNQTDRFSFAEYGIRLVSGIYAYNESTARDLIDRASSSLGNRGQYVLDTDWSRGYANGSGGTARGSYQYANSALVWADGILQARGEETYLDYNNTYVTDRTGVMGYASWGSNDCCDGGVTAHSLPRNEWVNGSIAETFVSTGGRTFTWPPSYGQSLIADWIDEGVSGIKGYVNEPYIIATAEGHILFDRYTRGYNLAESFWSASYVMGWRQILIGDPKMAPYADVGDIALNISFTVAPPQVEQDATLDLTVAVGNTAAVAREVDLRLGLPGGARVERTLSAAANGVSLFPLSVDMSAVPAEFWGPLDFTLELDPNNTVREWDESNNTGTLRVEVRRVPLAEMTIDAATIETFDVTSLRLSALRADRAIATFHWRVDGGPWQASNATDNRSVADLSYARSGLHTFEAYAVDVAGLASPVVGGVSLTVLNRAPVAAAAANDSAPLSLVPVALDGSSSSDLDGAVVAYLWDGGPVGSWTEPLVVVVFDRPGAYVFNLTVTDDEGGQAQTTVAVEVQNRPPVALASTDATEALSAVPFTIDASGSFDPDGEVAEYTFGFDGAAEVSGLDTSASHAFGAPGTVGVWVTVTDDWGATDRVRVTLLVLDRAPLVNWTLGPAETVTEGDAVRTEVTVADPDSNLFSYAVDYGDGAKSDVVLSGRQTTFSLAHTYDFEGEYDIVLTVADVEGNTTTLTSTLLVEHPAPVATSFAFTVANGTLTVAFDIDSPYPDLVTVVIYLDGVPWRTFPAPYPGSMDLPLDGIAPGNHSLRFEVTDGVKTVDAAAGALTVEEPDEQRPPGGDGGGGGAEPAGGGVDALAVGVLVAVAAVALAGLLLWRRQRPPEAATGREGT